MLNKYLLFVFILFSIGLSAQIVTIPDPQFKSILVNSNTTDSYFKIAKDVNGNFIAIDANNNDEIEESEALAVFQLNVGFKQIDDMTGVAAFLNLTSLRCEINNLVALDVRALNNLTFLDTGSNDLTNLLVDNLNALTYLRFDSNPLNQLDITGLNSLIELRMHNTNFTSLDVSGLSTLEKLWCGSMNASFTSLNVTGLQNLKFLDCTTNDLTTLDVTGLIGLETLRCQFNDLPALDVSANTNLISLYCQGNAITNLDVTNSPNLELLECSSNGMTQLDLLGLENLIDLDCSFNSLQTLDLLLLHDLESLQIRFNQLLFLDATGLTSIETLIASDNPAMEFMLLKNGVNWETNVFGNIWAGNTALDYVCSDPFNELYFEGLFVLANPEVNGYCSFTPGGEYFLVTGDTRYDADNSGCDVGDPIVPFAVFNIQNGNGMSTYVSSGQGAHDIPFLAGSHTITPSFENPTYFNVSPPSITVNFPADPSPVLQDFCVTPNGIHPDLEVVIMPTTVARPGFEAEYKLIYSNKGNQTQSGEVTLTYNEFLTEFISANPLFDSQNNNIFTWNYMDLEPFESREIDLVFEVNSPMDTPPVDIGDELGYASIIYPVSGDDIPEDNAFELKQTVVGSEDPNDKRCLQGETVLPEFPGDYAHYLIRFENIGTFAAENIVVSDIIDFNEFDISSLRVLGGSHDFFTRIEGNDVEFIFEGINLPFDPANNDGYVLFKVRTLSSLQLGDSFSNRASIFFDYNFPINTNTYLTTIEEALGTADFAFAENFILYPNPAKELLNIHSKKSIEIEALEIYNNFGQLVTAQIGASEVIDIKKLAAGLYFLKISTNQGISMSEFIKE